MKESYSLALVCTIVLMSMNTLAQSIALPSSSLSQDPLGTVENSGAGIASFTFAETSGLDVPGQAFNQPNVSISVDLNYVVLKDNNVNTITGNLLDYFAVSYDEATSILLFRQKNTIPGDWTGAINFPIRVIQNSTEIESFKPVLVCAASRRSSYVFTSLNFRISVETKFSNNKVYLPSKRMSK